jgi:hypothetical protein
MASYKLEIQKKFGKFQYIIYKAGAAKPDFGKNGDLATIQDVLGGMDKELSGIGYDEDGDDLVFRGVAYSDVSSLKVLVRDATY